MSDSQDVAQWSAELEKIHQQVLEARRQLSAGQIPEEIVWQPPTVSALPSQLRNQALKLQSELQDVQARIMVAMDNNREERDRLRQRSSQKTDPKPVYLDVQG
ncbi:hypothetical protein [uncultured Mobiluncus sp.]|uniref:hypothetical protein n=1 Tax=uncultured Mobiluncus sp. TaxID=293425 RepID=UPI00288C4152|nr:hypothetical protein [uncultured Mobiluncus sp.]